MKRAIFLALLLSFAGPALAADWFFASKNITGTLFYIDESSINMRADNKVYYWVKMVHKNINKLPGGDIVLNGKKAWYSMSLNAADCKNNYTYHGVQTIVYGLHHELLMSYTKSSYELQGTVPIPDTTENTIHELICNYWEIHSKQE